MLYRYKIITTNSVAEGTIDAGSEAKAKSILEKEYTHDKGSGGQFVDDKKKPVEHKLLDITLEAVG